MYESTLKKLIIIEKEIGHKISSARSSFAQHDIVTKPRHQTEN